MLLNPFQAKPHPFLALLYSPGPQSKHLFHLFRTFWELIPSITFSECRCLSPQWCSLHLSLHTSPLPTLQCWTQILEIQKCQGSPLQLNHKLSLPVPSRGLSLFPNVACVLSILSTLPLPKTITLTLSHNLSLFLDAPSSPNLILLMLLSFLALLEQVVALQNATSCPSTPS